MENSANGHRTGTDDPFLLSYNPTELRIASEFLSRWLPFLSRSLCNRCTRTLSDRIRSLDPGDGGTEPLTPEKGLLPTPNDNKIDLNEQNWDTNSVGSWKDSPDLNDVADANSLGSWKDGESGLLKPSWDDGASGLSETVAESSTSETAKSPACVEKPRVRMSWADMAQEDELEGEEDTDESWQLYKGNAAAAAPAPAPAPAQEDELEGEEDTDKSMQLYKGNAPASAPTGEVSTEVVKATNPKPELSREEREYIRFNNVQRKKDFICLERINGKIVNILDGLELHTGVFSAVEQKRITDYVYSLEEMGKKGEFQERTFSAPQKWMRGKGRVTIQFGCCYNYVTDKEGNPPGILQKENVDPIPHLFKVIIRRLVSWHILPATCVPDSCIVNIYDEGDCIPPHIDNHDFVRPFCTVSFLSECNILFGSNLKPAGPGEFAGSIAIPLPVGSVLVLNGNGADVAKHCVPAVPTKRISITFRKMDESKWPVGFVPEPDLQGLQPLSYEPNRSNRSNYSKSRRPVNRQVARREDQAVKPRGLAERSSEHRSMVQIRIGPGNRRRVLMNFD